MTEIKLKVSEQAPEFETTDIYGEKIALKDYKNKPVMLCFFRYAGCPFCAVAFLKLLKAYPLLSAKGLHIISFFQSSVERINQYITKYQPPFPVVADPQKEIYSLYKIPSTVLGWPRSLPATPEVFYKVLQQKVVQGTIDGDPNLIPGSFLVGPPELTIYQAYYGNTFLNVFSLDDIDEFLNHVTRITK